jgi:hypothetical protein
MDMLSGSSSDTNAFSNSITAFDGLFNKYLSNQGFSLDINSMFNNSNYFSVEDLSVINTIPSLDELERLSSLKNDVDSMIRVFPSLEDIIEDVDM